MLHLRLFSTYVCMLLAAACSRTKTYPEYDLARSVKVIARDLAQQVGPSVRSSKPTLVIDPLLDSATGQQTSASEELQRELTAAMRPMMPWATFVAFDAEGASSSRLVVTGTVTALPEAGHFRMSVALSDRTSGLVVAQAAAPFHAEGMKNAPTRFYQDSPSLTRDRSVDGYVRTAETPKGQPADALYIEQLPTSALLADALTAYNEQRWEDALTRYNDAVKRPDGQQLRTFNGIYLCNMKLNRVEQAEAAFAKIVALGLATNNLAVKLLFRPGSTEFWPDSKVSGHYPMWIKQIAQSAKDAKVCLRVVGHTSRSGTEERNRVLSEDRAKSMRKWLENEAPGLGERSSILGVGSNENIVGTGADDASDAVDRRVEFRVVECGQPATAAQP